MRRNTVLLVLVLWGVRLPGEEAGKAATNARPGTAVVRPAQYWWQTYPKFAPKKTLAEQNSTTSSAPARPVFHWRQIESTDYREYVQNLRHIGCPEQTLWDIVSADVVQAYATRRREALAARYRNFKFWRADAEAVAELARQRRAVDGAMAETLHTLIGEDLEIPSTAAEWQSAELEQQFAFLPPEKRKAAQTLLLRYAETDAQIKQLADGHRRNEDTEELQRIVDDYNRRRAALAQLLNPGEFELVELTSSWTAHNLRRAMTNFRPSEAEFRVIFREWRAHDENLARRSASGQSDPGDGHVFARLRELLGEERYQEYRRTWWN